MLCEGRFVCRDDDMDDAKVSNAIYIASLKLNERCCVNSDRSTYMSKGPGADWAFSDCFQKLYTYSPRQAQI